MNSDIEKIFLDVLKDVQEYLPDLTLVGGWMPYVYSNYFWKISVKNPVTTVDIDFGVDQYFTKNYVKTIYETLFYLNYSERHLKMDRMFPVVLYKGKYPVEFITHPSVDLEIIEKVLGSQILVNKINKFDFLLKNRISINIPDKRTKMIYRVNCPKPSAFLYHKCATFIDRENEEKQAKDLYYIYFILRFAPDIDLIMKVILNFRKAQLLNDVQENIDKYFKKITSQGCLMVERVNGPDEFIYDLRQDIFDRFSKLRDIL